MRQGSNLETHAFRDVGPGMPIFYFHLYNDDIALDEEGKDLPDISAAREMAIHCARDLIGNLIKERRRINLHHRIEVE